MWSFVERAKSSSFRELLAVDLALKSFQHFIIGKKVRSFQIIRTLLVLYTLGAVSHTFSRLLSIFLVFVWL